MNDLRSDPDNAGRNLVITGASGTLGRAIAAHYFSEGWSVTGRRAETGRPWRPLAAVGR